MASAVSPPRAMPRKPEMMARQMRPLVEEANTTAKDPTDSRHQFGGIHKTGRKQDCATGPGPPKLCVVD